MRKPLLIAAAAALALTAAVTAPIAAPSHKPAAPAAAPVWTVDKAESRLTFRATANSEGFGGVFKTWDAQIAFDPKNLKASRAMVSVVMSSVVTGDPTRDQKLPTADWFDISKFAKATYETSTITETAPGHYLANGALTLHGVKQPLALPFTLVFSKDGKTDVAKMEGSTTVDRMAFGVGKGQAGGPETVAPQVTVQVKLIARKAH